jgi:hypothetical protein
MSWRVHLANSAIRMVEVVAAPRPLLAAWTSPSHVSWFDLQDGALVAQATLPPLPPAQASSEVWASYQQALSLSEDRRLTRVQYGQRWLFLTRDGTQRLHWDSGGALLYASENKLHSLASSEVARWLAVDFDRDLGFTAALAEDGRLFLYERHLLVGSFDIGLCPEAEQRCHVQIQRGQHVYVTDGQTLAAVGVNGVVRKRLALHFRVALMTSSSDGQMLAIVDYEDGILRLYRSADLMLSHQKFAIDLMIAAAPRQLIEELPPPMTVVSSLALASQGVVAFAMGGVLCCTHQDAFNVLPR